MVSKASISILGIRLLNTLPLIWCRNIGRFLGQLLLPLDKRSDKTIATNLAVAFPEKSQQERQLLKKLRFANMGMTLFEIGNVLLKSPGQIGLYCNRLSNDHPFVQACQSEKGIILLVPHIGNWEVMNLFLSQYRPRTILYRPLRDKKLDQFFCDVRQKAGTQLVPINNSGVKQLIKALKQQGMVVMLPDQVPVVSGGIHAPFFGQPALTMTLAQRLAKKNEAKVFIGVANQIETGFEIKIEEIADDFYSEDEQVSATSLNRHIEEFILACPEQNQWEYKRYKFCPDYMDHDLYGTVNKAYRPQTSKEHGQINTTVK